MFSLGHKEKRARVGTRKEGFGRILYSKAEKGGAAGPGEKGLQTRPFLYLSPPLPHQTSPTPPFPGGPEL